MKGYKTGCCVEDRRFVEFVFVWTKLALAAGAFDMENILFIFISKGESIFLNKGNLSPIFFPETKRGPLLTVGKPL